MGHENNQACSEDDMVEMSSHLLRASLLGCAAADNDETDRWLELHASIRAHGCPWSRVCGIFMRRYRQQCEEKDASGRYPLHLIYASNKVRNDEWGDAATSILRSNHRAASEADCDGNLPLHLYFRSGALFKEDSLNEVFNTFPEALSVQNQRGFTPLHVALLESPASVNQPVQRSGEAMQSSSTSSNETEPVDNSGKGEDEGELSRINSVYWLLKKDPSAIDVALRWETGDSRKKMRT